MVKDKLYPFFTSQDDLDAPEEGSEDEEKKDEFGEEESTEGTEADEELGKETPEE